MSISAYTEGLGFLESSILDSLGGGTQPGAATHPNNGSLPSLRSSSTGSETAFPAGEAAPPLQQGSALPDMSAWQGHYTLLLNPAFLGVHTNGNLPPVTAPAAAANGAGFSMLPPLSVPGTAANGLSAANGANSANGARRVVDRSSSDRSASSDGTPVAGLGYTPLAQGAAVRDFAAALQQPDKGKTRVAQRKYREKQKVKAGRSCAKAYIPTSWPQYSP